MVAILCIYKNTFIFFRVQNFRLHHADRNVNQSYEVHRINRMFGRRIRTEADDGDLKAANTNGFDRNSNGEIIMDSMKSATGTHNDCGSLYVYKIINNTNKRYFVCPLNV